MMPVPEVKVDVAKILTIIIGAGIVGTGAYLAYKTANKARENRVYDAATGAGYSSAQAQATRLKNALDTSDWFDFNVDEEEIAAVLAEIKTLSRFEEVASFYRKLTGNQLLNDLRKVGNQDYLLIENHLKKLN